MFFKIAGKRIRILFECNAFVALMEARGDVAIEVLKAALEIGTCNLIAIPKKAKETTNLGF